MELLKENERGANKAAAKVMRITAVLYAAVLILDIVGIFKVKLDVMIITYIICSVLLLIPTFINLLVKKDSPWKKYAIMTCAVLFTVMSSATLSYHVVVLYVYPIAIASLYFSLRLNIFTSIVAVIGVSVGQIAAFNLRYVTDDNFDSIKEAVLFGILPRAIILLAISTIFIMLGRRTTSMLGSLMGAEQQRIMREKSKEVSDKLIDTVHELDNISSSAALANRSIAEQSESVMRDSVENAEHIRSVDDSMNMISESLKRLSEMSLRIAALTRSADEITAENDRKISEAATSMDEICNGTNESKEIIFNLSEQSKRIEAIVDVITDISFQTNILALNASVEAAHAEEYGKGFAVVAGEIKKLSEQTKEAAAEIGDIIDHVTSNISATVKAMEKNAALTMEGKEGMENIKASAARISTSNSEISKNISDMNDVISTVAENGTAVLRKLESVSGNISNNCAAIENMAAAIEETSAGTETLGSMVKDISVMAEELERLSK